MASHGKSWQVMASHGKSWQVMASPADAVTAGLATSYHKLSEPLTGSQVFRKGDLIPCGPCVSKIRKKPAFFTR